MNTICKDYRQNLKFLFVATNYVALELGMFQMNIGASEWGIIILIVVILLVGSNRFSGLARVLGQAVGEYDKARKVILDEKNNSQPQDQAVPQIKGPVGSEREKLTTIARALGIEESELTDDQLRSLISQKIGKI